MLLMTSKFFEFFAKGKQCHYKKGEILIRPDDHPFGVYYIENGYVKIYSITEEGDEKLHIIYKPGEVFPLIWALKSSQKNLYYEALDDLLVRRVTQKDFVKFISQDPKALFELADRLALSFDLFIDRVDNLEITKAYPRLVAGLLFLAKRFGVKSKGKVIIQAPIVHKDIASSISMTRETASREMAKLEKKGLVSYQGHLLVINSIKDLEKELSVHKEKEPL